MQIILFPVFWVVPGDPINGLDPRKDESLSACAKGDYRQADPITIPLTQQTQAYSGEQATDCTNSGVMYHYDFVHVLCHRRKCSRFHHKAPPRTRCITYRARIPFPLLASRRLQPGNVNDGSTNTGHPASVHNPIALPWGTGAGYWKGVLGDE